MRHCIQYTVSNILYCELATNNYGDFKLGILNFTLKLIALFTYLFTYNQILKEYLQNVLRGFFGHLHHSSLRVKLGSVRSIK